MKPEVNYEKLDRLLAQLRLPEGMPLLSFEPDLEPTPRIALRNNLIAAGAGALCFAVVIGAAAWAFQQQSDSMIDPPASTVTSSSGPPSVSSVVSELEVSSEEEPVSSEEISSSESVSSEETSSEEVPVSSQEESSLPESVAEPISSQESQTESSEASSVADAVVEIGGLDRYSVARLTFKPEYITTKEEMTQPSFYPGLDAECIKYIEWNISTQSQHDYTLTIVFEPSAMTEENCQRVREVLRNREDLLKIRYDTLTFSS